MSELESTLPTSPPSAVVASLDVDRELDRARALAEYGLLEERERPELSALVALAAQVCGVPMATLNILTATQQRQTASVGFAGTVTPRSESMCAVVLDEDEPVIVADASRDDRFSANPWVTGASHIRFYASHQLITPGDVAIGSLCVFDTEPHEVDAEQADALATLADRVVDVLELEMRSRRLASDVARLRRTEQELTRSNEELTGFAAQVSHDLRGPLTTVLSAHEMLAERLAVEEEPDPSVLWLLQRGTDAAHRMSTLIDGVLAYASVGGQRADEPVALDELVDGVCADLGRQLREVSLHVGQLPTVRGDALQLRILVQNLLGNAVKFADPDRPTRIEVTATPTDDAHWRISVVDHGRGLPGTEPTAVLFEPYQRGGSAVGVAGVGLGLATCRKVVEAHGGRIGLDPTPGGGATAWFELPA